jgi:DNA-binding NarL/FixJ family response regulator
MPTLVIVSEIRLFREGLVEQVARRDSLEVIGSASGFDDALLVARDLAPDVIVLDQAITGSLALARALGETQPQIRVVAVGVADVGDSLLDFTEAGVAACVPRDGSIHDLVVAVEGAVRGELHCSPKIAGTIARRLAWRAAASAEAPSSVLTAREIEVVSLISSGRSNKEIATALGIEVATVKNHVHKVLEKLNVRRRAEVAARLVAMPPMLADVIRPVAR